MPDSDNKRHFDIADPEGAKATPSSRPIIVNKGPLLHDPMVRTDEAEATDKMPLTLKDKVSIKPISSSPSKDLSEEGKAINEIAQDSEKSELDNGADDDDVQQPEKDVTSHSDAVNSMEKDQEKGNSDKKSEADNAEQAHIQQLITEKTYALPIAASKQKRVTQITGLLILAAIVVGVVVYLS